MRPLIKTRKKMDNNNNNNGNSENTHKKSVFSDLKKKLDSLTLKQKTNYIAIPLLVLVFGGAFVALVFSDDKKDNAIDDFTTPESELIKYNNKLDAVNKTADQSQDQNFSLQPSTPDQTDQAQTNTSTGNYDAELANLDRQLSASSNKSNSGNSGSGSSNNSTASNAHNVYGDYDMWQNREPANSKIGYSEKKWKQPIPQEKYDETPVVSKTKAPAVEEISTPSYQQPSKSIAAAKQIPASLISSGYATDGSKVTLVLLEPTTIAGQQVKKGQAISGTVKEENGRMLVDVQTININKKIYQANVKVLAEDGIEGIYIGGGKGRSRLGESAKDAGGQVANNAISRIPVVGGVLSGVVSGGRRDSGQEPIKLNPGTRAIILVY
ncbi:conjugative transposon protein TraM [Elizabethkingia anophelis]|nr:conjugative transposon protein TraM [Elizabethkingia anophelis]